MTLSQFLGDGVDVWPTPLEMSQAQGQRHIRMSAAASSSIDRQIGTTWIFGVENLVATLANSNTSAVMRCRAG